jgi:hypothetical protein
VAVCETVWTVQPHDPIQEIDDRVWRVEGVMKSGLRRTQTLVRLDDGRILVHNAVALRDEEMARIDAWGEVAAILVPNGFHRADCRIFQERYPQARVYAPRGAVKKVAEATPVHGTYDDVPTDASVVVRHLPGIKEQEGVLEVRGTSGLTVVFNDMITNVAKAKPPIEWFVGPTGQVSIPRFARWLWNNDKRALRADLERIAAEAARVVPGHGADLTEDVAARMGEAIALV